MVCRPGHTWVPSHGGTGCSGSRRRSSGRSTPMYAGPEGALRSDPAWTRTHALLDVVPLPAVGKAAAHLAFHRVRSLLAGG